MQPTNMQLEASSRLSQYYRGLVHKASILYVVKKPILKIEVDRPRLNFDSALDFNRTFLPNIIGT
jgi:hypothetical protein